MMAVEYLRIWILLLTCLQAWTAVHFCWAQLHHPALAFGRDEPTCWALTSQVADNGIIDLSAMSSFRGLTPKR